MLLAALVPFVAYVDWVPRGLAWGDGPELLTAAWTFGVAHPSGYPVWVLLAGIAAHLPGAHPAFLVGVGLSAVPVALAAGLLAHIQHRLGVRPPWSLVGALAFGFNEAILEVATRVEVYALHSLLVTGTLALLVRSWQVKDPGRSLSGASFMAGLGLACHLSSVALVPAVALTAFLRLRVGALRPRVWAPALVGPSLYLHLFAATARSRDGSFLAWDDVVDWPSFVYHATGAAYTQYRAWANLFEGLENFLHRMDQHTFGGTWFLCVLGLVALAMRAPGPLASVAAYVLPVLLLIGTVDISDIHTWYSGVLPVMGLLLGVAADGIGRAWPAPRLVAAAATVGMAGWAMDQRHDLAWMPRRGLLAEGIVGEARRLVEPGDFLFSDQDECTFPFYWFTYGEDSGAVHMHLPDRPNPWHREHWRTRYPDVSWPDFDDATFVRDLLLANPDRKAWSCTLQPWREPGTHAESQGFLHAITPVEDSQRPRTPRWVRFIHPARLQRLGGKWEAWDTAGVYATTDPDVACVVRWYPEHEKALEGLWTFIAPDGRTVAGGRVVVSPRDGMSWQVLPMEHRRPGAWTCRVTVDGEVVRTGFTLVGPAPERPAKPGED